MINVMGQEEGGANAYNELPGLLCKVVPLRGTDPDSRRVDSIVVIARRDTLEQAGMGSRRKDTGRKPDGDGVGISGEAELVQGEGETGDGPASGW